MVNGGSCINPDRTVPEPQGQLPSVNTCQGSTAKPVWALLHADFCTSTWLRGDQVVLSVKCPWLECLANDLVSDLLRSPGPLQLLPITQEAAYEICLVQICCSNSRRRQCLSSDLPFSCWRCLLPSCSVWRRTVWTSQSMCSAPHVPGDPVGFLSFTCYTQWLCDPAESVSSSVIWVITVPAF